MRKILFRLSLVSTGILAAYILTWLPLWANRMMDYRTWYNAHPELHPACPILEYCDSPGAYLMGAYITLALFIFVLIIYLGLFPLKYPVKFKLIFWDPQKKWMSAFTLLLPLLFFTDLFLDLYFRPVLGVWAIGAIDFLLFALVFVVHRSLLLSAKD